MLDAALVRHWLQPDWQVPGVRAWCTTRAGQLSRPPYDGFNTASHVGDDPESVARCRRALADYFAWSRPPQWLRQVHGIAVVDAAPYGAKPEDGAEPEADAVYTREPEQVCTLHTADCLPVFFAAADGSEVALAHAGWRGLAAGVLEAALAKFGTDPYLIKVWLGPAISQPAFEVGDDVRDVFLKQSTDYSGFFQANERGRWQGDLYGLARVRLNKWGVQHITGGGFCTYTDPRFFSFRRQPVTGRLLSMIWIDPAQ
ncbi:MULTISPECIES: peptidoglycan editing factor PgeF [unclassified Ketobacter]|uniref:peptidoglycan editing factor PgeF n=1 Tax=unclassified Ketobacter TaxID=2639109 RepID=UPI000F2794B8|nr:MULTISPECIES: peptidoglycan editing factor PgeF [unclassified Ketobacter]RLT88192.1 MAG: peptidoglycan editing factor PgeF [Ketobacter sp. GenoA1]RLT94127.1 MAG: peptidoglycan editing factor PgeF [Ketobacter sp.]